MSDSIQHSTSQGGHDNSIARDLVLHVFQLNGRLVETGNRLVAGIGLTTAWWQVLGALGYSPVPLPVSHIARNMGLSRQAVQRVVDLLAERAMVRFEANPHHQRAKLVVLTGQRRAALAAAERCERPLNDLVVEKIGHERIAAVVAVLAEMEALLAGPGAALIAGGELEDVA